MKRHGSKLQLDTLTLTHFLIQNQQLKEDFEMADDVGEKKNDDGGTKRDYGGRIPKKEGYSKSKDDRREGERGGEKEKDRGSSSRRGREEERDKERRRHTSRSESESNSQRGSSSDRDGRPGSASTLEERLRAMQGEPGEPRGKWLEKELEQWKKRNDFDESKPPTAEEIKMQLKLPPRVPQGEQVEFKEPLRQWEVTDLLPSL